MFHLDLGSIQVNRLYSTKIYISLINKKIMYIASQLNILVQISIINLIKLYNNSEGKTQPLRQFLCVNSKEVAFLEQPWQLTIMFISRFYGLLQ